jgi:hypothetical protein
MSCNIDVTEKAMAGGQINRYTKKGNKRGDGARVLIIWIELVPEAGLEPARF